MEEKFMPAVIEVAREALNKAEAELDGIKAALNAIAAGKE